jgi:hypothetical protein
MGGAEPREEAQSVFSAAPIYGSEVEDGHIVGVRLA